MKTFLRWSLNKSCISFVTEKRLMELEWRELFVKMRIYTLFLSWVLTYYVTLLLVSQPVLIAVHCRYLYPTHPKLIWEWQHSHPFNNFMKLLLNLKNPFEWYKEDTPNPPPKIYMESLLYSNSCSYIQRNPWMCVYIRETNDVMKKNRRNHIIFLLSFYFTSQGKLFFSNDWIT